MKYSQYALLNCIYIIKKAQPSGLKSSIISKMRKVSVLATGFFINLGANPLAQPPLSLIFFNSNSIKCSLKSCRSVKPWVCNLARMI